MGVHDRLSGGNRCAVYSTLGREFSHSDRTVSSCRDLAGSSGYSPHGLASIDFQKVSYNHNSL
jgi:hypothetical protein